MQPPTTSDDAVTATDHHHRTDVATPGADMPTGAWWLPVLTVVAMASWPFLDLLASNPDAPLDLSVVRTWWLVTLLPTLTLTVVVLRWRPRLGRWLGALLGVVVWLTWSLSTTTALRDSLGVDLGEVTWWSLVAVPVVAIAAFAVRAVPAQRFVAVMAVVLAGTSAIPHLAAQERDTTPPPVADSDDAFVRTNDVWFVMLDALAGSDVLQERGLDDTAFLNALRDDGFRIQTAASSNYPLTNLSLSSTLSMDYTFRGTEEPLTGDYFLHMSGSNPWVELLRSQGYGYVHAYPGFYNGSRCAGHEDVCIGDDGSITDTETALATRTPLRGLLLLRTDEEDIARTNDPAEQVARALSVSLDRPTYHFIHSLNPHPPLLRDADCTVRDVSLRLSGWGDGPDYLDAVRCVHDQLVRAADLILADDPEAIVVIQGDHGPRLDLGDPPDRFALLDDDDHFSILSAIHLPDACDDIDVPNDLTPVNTFRIVRACLEDRDPDLLDNRRFPIQRRRP